IGGLRVGVESSRIVLRQAPRGLSVGRCLDGPALTPKMMVFAGSPGFAAVSTTTFMAKKGQVSQTWHLIDATDQVVGRLAVQIATILRGKHRPEYTPHIDTGDYVIVINAEKVRFTGNKWDSVTYKTYSHYPGGLKVVGARE